MEKKNLSRGHKFWYHKAPRTDLLSVPQTPVPFLFLYAFGCEPLNTFSVTLKYSVFTSANFI